MRSKLRTWLQTQSEYEAFLFTGFPKTIIGASTAEQWCNMKLDMHSPELVGQPSVDAEVMPNLVYVQMASVSKFNERKEGPLKEAHTLWKESREGKDSNKKCNRPRIRQVDPTGEDKAANSSEEEKILGEQDGSGGSASASSSCPPSTSVRHISDIPCKHTFVHFPEHAESLVIGRSASEGTIPTQGSVSRLPVPKFPGS